MCEGKWEKKCYGIECRKTLGVVGMGELNELQQSKGLGMSSLL